MNKIFCATFDGLNARVVEVQSSFLRGMPSFSITGLAGASIQESKPRIQSALMANNFTFPPLKITINLAPADLPKQGSFYDLPIALSIALYDFLEISNLMQTESLDSIESIESKNEQNAEFSADSIKSDSIETDLDLIKSIESVKSEIEQGPLYFAFGELSLDGALKNTQSIYPLIFSLLSNPQIAQNAIFLLPKEAAEFYCQIPNLNAIYVENLKEAINAIQECIKPENAPFEPPFESLEINNEKFYFSSKFPLDFSEVLGQQRAKRAALIAACGFHNILLEGSAGSGKSMIAQRLRYILPPLSLEQMLKIAATSGSLELNATRPFRNPHSSATNAAIFGSAIASGVKFGELALADLGILFFDELPQFPKTTLENMRESLQNHFFTLSRLHAKITYSCDFLFVSAMNPCPCGNLLSKSRECRCNEKEIKRYKNQLSDPFLDRIDIYCAMDEDAHKAQTTDNSGLDSAQMQKIVFSVFTKIKKRHQSVLNARLCGSELNKFCALCSEVKEILDLACERFALSARARDKFLRLARSICDIESGEEIFAQISKAHLLEALSYRKIG